MANICGMVTASFSGGTTSGPISVPGLVVGDRVLQAIDTSALTDYGSYFERVVTVADEIQQKIAANISALTIGIVAYRGP
jgi:hypothetical protein